MSIQFNKNTIVKSPYEWDSRFNSLFLGGRCTRGVTRTIKKLFFPKYSHRKAKPSAFKMSTMKRGKKGRKIGQQLENELNAWVLSGVYPNMKETCVLIKSLKKKGFTTFQCQVPIGDEEMRLGTCLDLLAMDKEHNGVTLIELKTGYPDRFQKTCHSMNHPFSSFCDSPFNQHRIQALVNEILFRKTFPDLDIVDNLLIYVDPIQCSLSSVSFTNYIRHQVIRILKDYASND